MEDSTEIARTGSNVQNLCAGLEEREEVLDGVCMLGIGGEVRRTWAVTGGSRTICGAEMVAP